MYIYEVILEEEDDEVLASFFNKTDADDFARSLDDEVQAEITRVEPRGLFDDYGVPLR